MRAFGVAGPRRVPQNPGPQLGRLAFRPNVLLLGQQRGAGPLTVPWLSYPAQPPPCCMTLGLSFFICKMGMCLAAVSGCEHPQATDPRVLSAGPGRPFTLRPCPTSWQALACAGCSSLLRGSRMIPRLRDLPR